MGLLGNVCVVNAVWLLGLFLLHLCPQGTPALFLVLLFYNSSLVAGFVEDERWVSPCLTIN